MKKTTRRDFTAAVGASAVLGMFAGGTRAAAAASTSPAVLRLAPNDWVPNHPTLPVLHYRAAFAHEGGTDTAARMEAGFTRHGWPSQWRNGIYDYHHYHSNAHEVLGIARGEVRVMLGGPDGTEVSATAGDVLVLPAGTGHCRVAASADYLVIGAYPPGQQADLCRTAPTPAMLQQIRSLPFPATDPVSGADGPLPRLWHA